MRKQGNWQRKRKQETGKVGAGKEAQKIEGMIQERKNTGMIFVNY